MVTLDHAYRMVCLYRCSLDNDTYDGSILFEFSGHKLLASISGNYVWGSEVFIDPT